MFDNYSRVRCFTYEIDLGKPIEFICKLINEMNLLLKSNATIDTIFKEKFISEKIQIRFDKDGEGNDLVSLQDLISEIAGYYNKFVVDRLDLSKTSILLVHPHSKSIFVLNEPKNKIKDQGLDNPVEDGNKKVKELLEFIYAKNVLRDLVSNIKNANLRKSLLESLNIKFTELYYGSIKFKETKSIDMPYLPLELFKDDLVEPIIMEKEDVSVNYIKFKEVLSIELDKEKEISIIKTVGQEEVKEIGISYNGLVFPISAMDLRPLIKPELLFEYYWLRIKEVFARIEIVKSGFSSPILKEFQFKMKDGGLNKLLSYLRKNVYIDAQDLDSESPFFNFFTPVKHVQGLKYVENLNFFVTSENGKTALGIYTDTKPEEQKGAYNLLHWGMNNGGILDNHRDIHGPKKEKMSSVFALKPEITFYFLKNYFEDLLQLALNELSVEFIKNLELTVNTKTLGELDLIVKAKDKICIIEAKTTLNRFVIEGFQEKCNRLIDAFKPFGIKLEFYLLAAYSDKTCETFWHFIKDVEGYNKERDGLDCIPYNFDIPIPKSPEFNIKCIAEPEFDKIKTILVDICQ